jgi:hypothetical protein
MSEDSTKLHPLILFQQLAPVEGRRADRRFSPTKRGRRPSFPDALVRSGIHGCDYVGRREEKSRGSRKEVGFRRGSGAVLGQLVLETAEYAHTYAAINTQLSPFFFSRTT